MVGVRTLSLDRRGLQVSHGFSTRRPRRRRRCCSGFFSRRTPTVVVRQTSDLQALCRFEKGVELVLGNIHLPVVHELEQGEEVIVFDVSQHDDWVLAGVALKLENGIKFGATKSPPNS